MTRMRAKVLTVIGHEVNLYTDSECNSTSYSAEVDQCVQAGVPFISAFVKCPFSGIS